MRLPLLFLSISQIAFGSCPKGWNLVANGQCRGYVATTVAAWDERGINTAVQACNKIDASVISIHNDEQQAYWTRMSPKDNYLPIGIICKEGGNGKWVWSDGTKLDYKPKNYDDALDYGCVGGCTWDIKTDGLWDINCNGNKKLTEDIYCTTQLTPPQPSLDGCESFQDDQNDGMCYQIGAAAESWQEAQKICGSFGGQVASIHNDQENAFVRRVAVSRGATNGVFLGGQITSSGNRWIDSSPWDYQNFYAGFPVLGLGECLVMDTSGTAGDWANVDCGSSKYPVACERQQHHGAPVCLSGPWHEGDIMYSPGFPTSANTPCDFILSVDAGKRVEVEILLLEANSCCDHLVLYENYIGANVIADVTGEINDQKFTTKTSNFMRVSWQPQGGYNVRGMIMTYRSV